MGDKITEKQKAYLESLDAEYGHYAPFEIKDIDTLTKKQASYYISELLAIEKRKLFRGEYYDQYKNSKVLNNLLKYFKCDCAGLAAIPTSYSYYAFEGEYITYSISIDLFLRNFEILEHEKEILEEYNNSSYACDNHLFDFLIEEWAPRHEVLGGDLITA